MKRSYGYLFIIAAGLLMGCASLFALDAEAGGGSVVLTKTPAEVDDADYKAYREAQETAQKAKVDVEQRDAAVKQTESDIKGLLERYKGKSADEALTLWRADIRKIADPVQRFANYEWLIQVEKQVNAIKERTKVATAEAAISAEKVAITAAKAK